MEFLHGNSSSPDGDTSAQQSVIDILLVDDEDDFRESAADFFRRRGHAVTSVANGREALEAVQRKQFDAAVIDVHMPEMDGVQLLTKLRERGEDLRVVMLTGGATVTTAVASMKAGAADYVTKPIRLVDLEALIARAAEATQLQRENERLRAALLRGSPKSQIMGSSQEINEVRRLIERIAPSNQPVLIEGESGTGKELVARAIHTQSPLSNCPIVVINCAALPETLLESELFGYEKGAFTGAVQTKPGLFEVANGGTLFVDEFGELPLALQAKLLRVIEDGIIRRIGSVKERRVKVRLIAATNRDLEKEVREGRFREDLYYRINVLKIWIPPLRQRPSDIELLAKHFASDAWEFAPGVLETLSAYDWPGNVRQLRNALERGKLLAQTDHVIEVQNLPPEIVRKSNHEYAAQIYSAANSTVTPLLDLETLNRQHVEETLARVRGNKAEAARLLGIHRRSLYRLLEKYFPKPQTNPPHGS